MLRDRPHPPSIMIIAEDCWVKRVFSYFQPAIGCLPFVFSIFDCRAQSPLRAQYIVILKQLLKVVGALRKPAKNDGILQTLSRLVSFDEIALTFA